MSADVPGLVDLTVAEVRTAVPAGVGVEAGLVVLKEESGHDAPRYLRIVIGQPEARAIKSAWQGTAAQRPGTWDLFVTGLQLLEGRVAAAVIDAVQQERHFYAHLQIVREAHLGADRSDRSGGSAGTTGSTGTTGLAASAGSAGSAASAASAGSAGSAGSANTESDDPPTDESATPESPLDDEPLTLPCRPSDAIALALRTPGASICAEAEVLDEAGVLADGTKPAPRTSHPESDEKSSSVSASSPPPPTLRL